ncbi:MULTISPECIES: hypothetical protein [unclassified Shinella]|uniref:hypothetical protein n=1 Tax=unclassified Shinella TaxID=2643062 RepID=UPI0030C883D4
MTPLDDAILEAARSGLQGFTLFSTQDGRWQASTTRDRQSWSVHIAADPVSAMRAALGTSAAAEKTTDKGDIFA